MLSLKQRVDAIVRDGLVPHLKQSGFSKRGRTFRLALEDHTRIVSVNATGQKMPGQGVIGSFGVEIGVYFPDVFEIGNGKLKAEPRIHECYVYSGLPVSEWGHCDDMADNCPSVEEQATSLGDAWIEHGEAWFDRYSQPTEALQWAMSSEHWKEALYFSIYLKDWDLAANCLERCRRMWGGEWLANLEELAKRHGVS
jgi:hypothetical protein